MKKTVSTFFTILCLLSAVFLMGLAFNIQPVKATEIVYIRPDGSIDPATASISSVDNITYTFTDNMLACIVVERSNIVIDGNGHELGSEGVFTRGSGFDLRYMHANITNITIKNVTIRDFTCGVDLTHASNNTISGNKIFGCGSGIRLWGPFSSNNTVSENHMVDNGISISGSSNNTISGNYISGSGILVDGEYNDICGNTIEAPTYVGIRIDGSSHNSLRGNRICSSDMGEGIEIVGCSNCIVSGNNITDNKWGIGLHSSSNNSIFGNSILNNEYGISIKDSLNNSIHCNSFLNNEVQECTITLPYLKNSWDDGYPSGGNYWSDYKGTDSDNDGIGDTPYVIDANNTDNYPLMGTFSGFNATPEHHVQTICNSTISDFQFDGMAISFSVTGEDGTVGFCRVCIPTALMNDTFRVFVDGIEILPSPEPLPCSNGTHNYLYFAYEHSTHKVVIASEPPTISILSPENKTYGVRDVSLTFIVSESTSWIGYSLDGQANMTITGNKTLSDLSEELHSLIVYANDTAGNMGASEMVYFTIEIQQEEPFPTWIIAVIVIIGVVGAVVFVYFTKFKK